MEDPNHEANRNAARAKVNMKATLSRAIALFVLKFAVCLGLVEFLFRDSNVSQGIQIVIAWVASFLIGVLITLINNLRKK